MQRQTTRSMPQGSMPACEAWLRMDTARSWKDFKRSFQKTWEGCGCPPFPAGRGFLQNFDAAGKLFADFPAARNAKGAGKKVPRENCRKVSKKLFDTFWRFFWRFLPCAKIVEKCRKTFWHFLTIFDAFWRGPFPPPPFAIRWFSGSAKCYPCQGSALSGKANRCWIFSFNTATAFLRVSECLERLLLGTHWHSPLHTHHFESRLLCLNQRMLELFVIGHGMAEYYSPRNFYKLIPLPFFWGGYFFVIFTGIHCGVDIAQNPSKSGQILDQRWKIFFL